MVKLLSENYRGLGQMCNLLIHWLQLSGVNDNEIDKLIEEHIHNQIIRLFDPKKADSVFSAGQVKQPSSSFQKMVDLFTISGLKKKSGST